MRKKKVLLDNTTSFLPLTPYPLSLILAIFLGMAFFSISVSAQEDYVVTSASSLQSVLSHLTQSVEKLSLTNGQWVERNKAIKTEVLQLRSKLGRLKAQGGFLNKMAARLWDRNPRRARQIARLEKENFDLDHHIQVMKSQLGARPQKEKLKLLKMIYDSQERQESLHEAILEILKK